MGIYLRPYKKVITKSWWMDNLLIFLKSDYLNGGGKKAKVSNGNMRNDE